MRSKEGVRWDGVLWETTCLLKDSRLTTRRLMVQGSKSHGEFRSRIRFRTEPQVWVPHGATMFDIDRCQPVGSVPNLSGSVRKRIPNGS